MLAKEPFFDYPRSTRHWCGTTDEIFTAWHNVDVSLGKILELSGGFRIGGGINCDFVPKGFENLLLSVDRCHDATGEI